MTTSRHDLSIVRDQLQAALDDISNEELHNEINLGVAAGLKQAIDTIDTRLDNEYNN
jgi:hypothetical protein